ncbi:MAG: DUF4349 domain-containing protein [Gemmataceae bacterium]|nr:DUF4349 domain-containing protein [Gemmataceae bacterium]
MSDTAATLDDADADRLDARLLDLFAPSRPDAGLEDRLVGSLRAVPAPRPGLRLTGWPGKALLMAAGLSFLGLFGALVSDGRLPLPGGAEFREAAAPGDGRGIFASIRREREVDRLADRTSVGIVSDDPVGDAGSAGVGGSLEPLRDANTANPYQDAKRSVRGSRGGDDYIAKARSGAEPPGYAAGNADRRPQSPPAGLGGLGGGGLGGGGLGGGFAGGIGGGGVGGPAPGFNYYNGPVPGAYTTPGAPPADSKNQWAATPPPPGGGDGKDQQAGQPGRPAADYFQPDAQRLRYRSEDWKATDNGRDGPKDGRQDVDKPVRDLSSNPNDPQPPGEGKGEGKPQPKPDPKGPAADPVAPNKVEPGPQPTRRVVIRSGEIEFEVESFDGSVAAVTKLVAAIPGAFVATVNSDKLPNGKVRGSITVRVPPDALDGLVLDLRRDLGKGGELKGVKLTSADVTKQYTDLESRLRAARTMEQRLLQMIKDGKGEIKQLLEAERELGVWRTKIEEAEGELRYYANLAALSTLTITLAEKEARAAAGLAETERVQAGVEVDDVDKAYQQLLAAVTEAKGRVVKSELRQLAAGQFNATLNFEVAPDASGPLRDRLRQLGRVARLEVDRAQQPEGGATPPAKDAKVRRGDSVFLVQLYNLANVAPRETAALSVAAADVPKAYQGLREALGKIAGRVLNAQLNEQNKENVSAQVDFEVKRTDEGAAKAALAAAGEQVSRQVTRAPESDNVTDTKVLYRVTLGPAARLAPRETVVLRVAAVDVPAVYNSLRDLAGKAATGKVLAAQLSEQDRNNVSAQLDAEVGRADEAAVRAAVENAGDVLTRQVVRAAEGEAVTDAKVLYRVTLVNALYLQPRETTALTVEVADVDATAAVFAALAAEAKARTVDAKTTRDASGKATARLIYDVPLASADRLVQRFRESGQVRAFTASRNPQAPEGRFATAHVDVTLTGGDPIVGADEGVWPPVRKGLAYSASALLTSLTWVVFGLCVVLPWAVIGYAGYRVVRWLGRPAPAPAAVAATPTTPAT